MATPLGNRRERHRPSCGTCSGGLDFISAKKPRIGRFRLGQTANLFIDRPRSGSEPVDVGRIAGPESNWSPASRNDHAISQTWKPISLRLIVPVPSVEESWWKLERLSRHQAPCALVCCLYEWHHHCPAVSSDIRSLIRTFGWDLGRS